MFLCSLIEELCTKEENGKTGRNFNFGHECNTKYVYRWVFQATVITLINLTKTLISYTWNEARDNVAWIISESQVNATSASCDGYVCFFGARCLEKDGLPQCVCDFPCSPEDSRDPVCGVDGNTYGSECQLRLFSCRYQRPIGIRYYGICRKGYAGNKHY